MPEGKPRLARLTSIVTQLQSQPVVTAREIADRHQVSMRTVYRDIRTLEQSGIPIYTEEGKGYSIMDHYHLPPVSFTEDEANALITAEQIMLKNNDASLSNTYQKAITKIKTVLPERQKHQSAFLASRIQVRTNPFQEETSTYLIQLQANIAKFQVIELDYYSLTDDETKRLVEPFALYTTNNNWILIAFCRLRNDFRAFRLDRIRELTTTTETFEAHNMTLEQYLEECRKKAITP